MTCYIISYDLVKKRDYEELYKAIKSYKYGQINESTWAIVTNDTKKTIYNNLKKHIDSDDRLFIIKSGRDAIWCNAICKDQWLKDNL